MNARRTLLPLLALLAAVLALGGCFGSSSGPPLPIEVSFTVPPPTTVNVTGSFQVTAVVSNDGSGRGVNWSCAPSGACGSFSPTMVASGTPTTYTAPSTVPAGGSVTISAVSVSDGTKSATSNVSVSPGGAIAVAFSAPAPPPSLTNSGNAQLTATISSTVTNAVSDGVDWSAACTNSAGSGCGTFTSAHTASGTFTTFTSPPSSPSSGVAVTITASSTLDPADSVSAVITVSSTQSSAFLCAGCSYTYTFSGQNSITGNSFGVAGVLTADGAGNITGGEQDFSGFSFATGNTPDAIEAGSSYQFGADGRGTITLITVDANVGVNGIETLGVVFVSPAHLLITELDQSATASGTMDQQTVHSFSASSLSGGYAFVFSGATLPSNTNPSSSFGFGGVFNVTSPGSIGGNGSTSDANDGGAIATQQGLSGGFAVSDQLGRIQLTLNSGVTGAFGLSGPLRFDGYITDATHAKFVEFDSNAVTSGLAVGQGPATGTFTTPTVLPANSSFVFTTFGTGTVTGAMAFATTFTSDGVSNLQNGFSDVNVAGLPSSGNVTGTYSVDSAGTGRVAVTLNGNVGEPGNSAAFAVYLTGGPDPAMVLELDGNAITAGNAFTQAAGPFSLSSFNGPYGLNFTLFAFDATTGTFDIEADVSGQMLADGAGNLLGTLDINDAGTPVSNQTSSGNYASAASGRFTGTLTTPVTGTLVVSYFVISPTQVVFIETDTDVAVSLGLYQLQTPPF